MTTLPNPAPGHTDRCQIEIIEDDEGRALVITRCSEDHEPESMELACPQTS
jgi:hypothetical protein